MHTGSVQSAAHMRICWLTASFLLLEKQSVYSWVLASSGLGWYAGSSCFFAATIFCRMALTSALVSAWARSNTAQDGSTGQLPRGAWLL